MPLPGIAGAFGRGLGAAVKAAGATAREARWGGWFTPHSAAAIRAIRERCPLVDLVVEVRDARMPLSSAFQPVNGELDPRKRVILLSKVDLADRTQTENWIKHLKGKNIACYGVNSHNKENIKELLNFLRTKVRELKVKNLESTATLLLVGIPNVGKSAIANSLHRIGRITAAEKGQLKHAVLSSTPGVTKDISSYKIASHPNIYLLDTPGVLFSEIGDTETAAKLALTGSIKDNLVGECAIARYCLSILNSSEVYRNWKSLKKVDHDVSSEVRTQNKNEIRQVGPQESRKECPSDHTQDSIVRNVRQLLFETNSSFLRSSSEDELEMARLMDLQIAALLEVFKVPVEAAAADGSRIVSKKLLDLYRTGRLGKYTLDLAPE